MMQPIILIDAPSNLGLMPPPGGGEPGVAYMPEALRTAGLHTRLKALDGGVVTPLPYNPARDPKTGVRNAAAIAAYSRKLAEVIQRHVPAGQFPLVLGGDCSILIGAMLGLKHLGRYGLLFIDGHTDFQLPTTSRTGGVAGMDLAVVTGHGLDTLTNIEGLKPLVCEEDVVIFGNRDVQDRESYYAPHVFDSAVSMFDLDTVRRMGVEAATTAALETFKAQPLDGVWIHLDADALHNDIMPAVDSPQPDGLTYDELQTILRLVLQSGLAVGMEITIFDPELDPDGSIAQGFVDALATIFQN